MSIVEIDGVKYKDPTECGLELIPIDKVSIEEAHDKDDNFDELYPAIPIEL